MGLNDEAQQADGVAPPRLDRISRGARWRTGRGLAVAIAVVGILCVTLALVVATFAHRPRDYRGEFEPIGDMPSAKAFAVAALLPDGRVLLAGGRDTDRSGAFRALSSADLYDPRTGTFYPTGSMTSRRMEAVGAVLQDGRVLIAGGILDEGDLTRLVNPAELYDPRTGTFTTTGALDTARHCTTATSLPDGRVLIAGGMDFEGSAWIALTATELYDPEAGVFRATGPLTEARSCPIAVGLKDGRVLIAGGGVLEADGMKFRRSAELYDPGTGTFSPTGPMTTSRYGGAAALLPDGRVLIVGGYRNDNARWETLASAEIYDPESGTFSDAGSLAAGPRTFATATVLADGRVLVVGGYWFRDSDPRTDVATAELFDPRTGTFTLTGNLPVAESYATATPLKNGDVLIAGGGHFDGKTDTTLAGAWIFR